MTAFQPACAAAAVRTARNTTISIAGDFLRRPDWFINSSGWGCCMFTTPRLIAIALCAALNFAVGAIVYLVKLPIYMDSVGTILCAMLIFPDRWAAFVCALIAGLAGVAVIGLSVNPFLPWFSLTVVAIALVSAFLTASGGDVYRARPLQPVAFIDPRRHLRRRDRRHRGHRIGAGGGLSVRRRHRVGFGVHRGIFPQDRDSNS